LAEDFERLMAEDRDIVRGSLDTVSSRRLTRPADVPGQTMGEAIEHPQRLADDLAHLVSSLGMLVVRPVL
jgi:hypothetical protein